ncbi:hypothetical protein SAMN02745227_00433 [Anaerobranca californiensis DSM 14826]|jgi:hypothetical protein|uniref:von Willebrand factor type A domain-containing protein n=1 Tax=Anaerobranca californiensis DSM 14826 TaxID=1120989 RepID=A0A1M6LA89_9FIRM|nr:hypothetical protein [Anaerobranca californiensis]SHJ68072.1 hypothetical protein SAMN02745227_00433 [Anaerobranca californiensis DSM 14826]
MFFSFSKPYYLLLSIPILAYTWWYFLKNKSDQFLTRAMYMLRTLTFLFLIISLAGPSLVKSIDGQWVVFLADLSYSTVHGEDYTQWIEESSRFMGKNDKMAVLVFGKDTQLVRPFSKLTPINWQVDVEKEFTNIEGALKVAAGLLPGDVNGRIVLISDGYENIGDSLAFGKMLQGNNIPVDVYPLQLKIGNEVAVKGINIPANTYKGQQVLVEVELESTVDTEGELTLFWENKVIYKEGVKISKGRQTLVFPVAIIGAGFQRVKAVFQGKNDTLLENNRSEAITFVDSPPKVLVVEGRKEIGTALYHVFKENGIDVTLIKGEDFPKTLEGLLDYKGIFFVDVPKYLLSESSLNNLKAYVEIIGGGFVAIGGKNSFGMGHYGDSPLEEILPVTMEVESQQQLPGIELVLVIDRSGSMDGEKLNMAKNAGVSALDILGEKDKLALSLSKSCNTIYRRKFQ